MAGETIIKLGTPITLETNGASISNNAVAQADDDIYSVVDDGAGYPDAKFVVSFAFGTAPTENTTLELYARPLDISSTNDAEVPEATRPTVRLGSFVVNNVTSTQYAEEIVQDVPWKFSAYLHNNGTGQTVSAGWTLTITPCTVGPAA
jgi:hypothetical protein